MEVTTIGSEIRSSFDPVGSYRVDLDFVDEIAISDIRNHEDDDFLRYSRAIRIKRPYGVIEITVSAETREALERIKHLPPK